VSSGPAILDDAALSVHEAIALAVRAEMLAGREGVEMRRCVLDAINTSRRLLDRAEREIEDEMFDKIKAKAA
jgi:hypothetical protein